MEAYLKRRFPNVYAGRWIEYCDATGRHFAQPDFFLLRPHCVLVIESKLTEVPSAYTQISSLYRPLLRHIFQLPVVGVVVAKTLTRDPGNRLITGPEAILDSNEEALWTWHFLGE